MNISKFISKWFSVLSVLLIGGIGAVALVSCSSGGGDEALLSSSAAEAYYSSSEEEHSCSSSAEEEALCSSSAEEEALSSSSGEEALSSSSGEEAPSSSSEAEALPSSSSAKQSSSSAASSSSGTAQSSSSGAQPSSSSAGQSSSSSVLPSSSSSSEFVAELCGSCWTGSCTVVETGFTVQVCLDARCKQRKDSLVTSCAWAKEVECQQYAYKWWDDDNCGMPKGDEKWAWIENLEKGEDVPSYTNIPNVGAILTGCPPQTTPPPTDSLVISKNPDDLLNYYSEFYSEECFTVVQNKNSGKYYPVALWPVTRNEDEVLAKTYDPDNKDKLGYIFKGLLECMASSGASGCKQENIECGTSSENSLMFYRSIVPSPNANAMTELKEYVCQ